jgi:hypothetical protein
MGRRRPQHFLSVVPPEPPRRRRRPPPEREARDFQGESEETTSLEVVSTAAFEEGYLDRMNGRPPRNGYVLDVAGDYERGRAVCNFLIASGGLRRLPKATNRPRLASALSLAWRRGDIL